MRQFVFLFVLILFLGCTQQPPTAGNVSVNIILDFPGMQNDSNQTIQLSSSSTALTALKAVAETGTEGIAGFGTIVKSINGVVQNNTNYWAFYINGNYSMVGVDGYFVQEGDTIAFRLESLQDFRSS